jgi:hypothetical protein
MEVVELELEQGLFLVRGQNQKLQGRCVHLALWHNHDTEAARLVSLGHPEILRYPGSLRGSDTKAVVASPATGTYQDDNDTWLIMDQYTGLIVIINKNAYIVTGIKGQM